jgi:hypothetical protein
MLIESIDEVFAMRYRHSRVRWWVVDSQDHSLIKSWGETKNLIVDTSRPFVGDLVRGNPLSTALRALVVGSNTDAAIAQASPNNAYGVQTVDTKLNEEIGSVGNPIGRAALPVAGSTATAVVENSITGNVVTLRQVVSPASAGAVTVRECALVGDLPQITNPGAVDPTVAVQAGGTLANATYYCKYTFANAAGETTASNAKSATTNSGAGNSTVRVTAATALPSTATKMKVYANTDNGASFWYQGEAVGTNVYNITGSPAFATSGNIPPTTNLTLTAGDYETGRFFNRAFLGPASLTTSDSIVIEFQITFG